MRYADIERYIETNDANLVKVAILGASNFDAGIQEDVLCMCLYYRNFQAIEIMLAGGFRLRDYVYYCAKKYEREGVRRKIDFEDKVSNLWLMADPMLYPNCNMLLDRYQVTLLDIDSYIKEYKTKSGVQLLERLVDNLSLNPFVSQHISQFIFRAAIEYNKPGALVCCMDLILGGQETWKFDVFGYILEKRSIRIRTFMRSFNYRFPIKNKRSTTTFGDLYVKLLP
jgi:hypothetical protein